uniref:Uncharacterized protein n=1 Tax=Photinus pyralis TaxID=7054 RepID=A0A1Y1M9P0_PHOPY
MKNSDLKRGEVNVIQVDAAGKEHSVPVVIDENVKVRAGQVIGYVRGNENANYVGVKNESLTLSNITRNDLNLPKDVTNEQATQVLDLVNEFRDCFVTSIREVRCTNLLEMDIEDSDRPVRSAPVRQSAVEREITKKIVREWKDLGIVTETESPYASPVHLVQKKSGEPRLVVDYRKLNAQTARQNFPLPNMDEMFEKGETVGLQSVYIIGSNARVSSGATYRTRQGKNGIYYE